MADNYADVLSQLSSDIYDMRRGSQLQNSQIITILQDIKNNTGLLSVSAAADRLKGNNQNPFKQEYNNRSRRTSRGRTFTDSGSRAGIPDSPRLSDGFLDNLEEELLKGVFGDDFRDRFSDSLNSVIDKFKVNALDEIPGKIGQNLGKQLKEALSKNKTIQDSANRATSILDDFINKGTEFVKSQSENFDPSSINDYLDKGTDFIRNKLGDKFGSESVDLVFEKFKSVKDKLVEGGQNIGEQLKSSFKSGDLSKAVADAGGMLKNGLSSVTTKLGSFLGKDLSGVSSIISSGASAVGGVIGKLATGVATLNPAVLIPMAAVGLGFIALKKSIGYAIEGFKEVHKSLKASANRVIDSNKKFAELSRARLEADARTLVETPFKILEEAASELYSSWKSNLAVINQTQGYNKNDTMSLMASLAGRLRDEGLSDVIAGTDLVSSLSRVLESGLSGPIAEEFAYQALKLNKAVPTQDFFSYASMYSSVAANAIKDGKSQSAAIQEANESLYGFTNNVLYASRKLTGGFTTGLQNATSYYEQAVKIAQAARSNNVNQIGGVLTSVAAITGAIAPDLASSLTDVLYRAAVGGNSSEIVALRSLAGINASNTEFLKAFADDPQSLISKMFRNLGTMFSDSSDAYMEKAEGYAELFGISSEAFQRVDFNYLADQISMMNTSSDSLQDNIDLLSSGQSTMSSEQLKIAEINKMMVDEGLACVIDNEGAQMIQQHMWDEQLARQMQEAEYGVNIVGSAADLLSGIKNTVTSILNFLNPFRKIGAVLSSIGEGNAMTADVKQLLELSKVGVGNTKDLVNLTKRGSDLHLTSSLIDMMGGTSSYSEAVKSRKALNNIVTHGFIKGAIGSIIGDAIVKRSSQRGPVSSPTTSVYSWGALGSKSSAALASKLLTAQSSSITASQVEEVKTASEVATENLAHKMESMLKGMETVIKEKGTYDEWAATATKYGISNLEKAAEDAGYTIQGLKEYFETKAVAEDAKHELELKTLELRHYQTSFKFLDERFWNEYNTPLSNNFSSVMERQDLIHDKVGSFLQSFEKFKKDWEQHWKVYSQRYIDFNSVYTEGSKGHALISELQTVQKTEKSERGDLMTKLSEYLTSNDWTLEDFKDPQVQTNALLSQILIVVSTIMNQTNNVNGSLSLADTFSALSMGMIQNTV